VFEDRASGARADRAGLHSALDYVREGDVLVVWKLDRLGRSLPHLIETVTSLRFNALEQAVIYANPQEGERIALDLAGRFSA
jgi:DNA invertase Pin-like site-specific DNA recombinase